MYLYRHYTSDRPNHRRGVIWRPRFYWTLYSGSRDHQDSRREPRRIVGGQVEVNIQKPNAEFGASIEVGTRGSETPWDGHIKIAGSSLFWGLTGGSGLAQRLTQYWFNRIPNRPSRRCYDNTCDCPPWQPGATSKRHLGRNGQTAEHMYDGRALELRTYAGKLWVSAWTPKNGSSVKEFADWRTATIDLNLLNHLFGRPVYRREKIETRPIMVELPEMSYPVQATLTLNHRGRPRVAESRHERWWSVSVDAHECNGIPDRYDHSDGWKGDRVYGFGVRLKERRRDWHIDAKAAIEAHILQSRADSGFRKALSMKGNS